MVTTTSKWQGAGYIIQTEEGKDYTLEFDVSDVQSAEKLYVEARNHNSTDNKVISVNSIQKDGTYALHFHAAGDAIRVKFFTDSDDPFICR